MNSFEAVERCENCDAEKMCDGDQTIEVWNRIYITREFDGLLITRFHDVVGLEE